VQKPTFSVLIGLYYGAFKIKEILMFDTKQVLKKDMMDPFGGGKLKVKDIIFMQKGGTGFAAGGTKLDTHKYTPTMRAY
jgi:hypothetical protein